MQSKINVLARDSIMAPPIVLDLALFLDLAHWAGIEGVQGWREDCITHLGLDYYE
jgi:myo-inositol-1-phosphate synthase